MGHRTGYINGEGDGVGILTDIPRQLWTKWLAERGLRSSLATDRNFWVAHLMIPAEDRRRKQPIIDQINQRISQAGLHIFFDRAGKVNSQVLGPNAEKNEPVFWQIAGINGQVPSDKLDKTLFHLQSELEDELGVHFPSFSAHSVVYKVQGTIEILRRYYPELRDPDYASIVTMGHARYSTNTNPIFERAQPFGVLGHNGEFNTISRFRMEADMLGIHLDPSNSDSQDVDRVVQALCLDYGLDLIEALEHIFPPYGHDLIQNDSSIAEIYQTMRQAFGPFAQGPAAVAARLGNLCVFSVDALGLRPLWFGETEKEYFASSERGVYPLDVMSRSPKPIAPGEKIALKIERGYAIEVLDYPTIQRHIFNRYKKQTMPLLNDNNGHHPQDTNSNSGKYQPNALNEFGNSSAAIFSSNGNNNSGGNGTGRTYSPDAELLESNAVQRANDLQRQLAQAAHMQGDTLAVAEVIEHAELQTTQTDSNTNQSNKPTELPQTGIKINAAVMSALGWERYHLGLTDAMAERGKEQIGSLGWDGPLAALSHTRVNIADYFKETVAVVTNPAIDREREQSQFSTQTHIGVRPNIGEHQSENSLSIDTPLILGAIPGLENAQILQEIAETVDTFTVEQIVGHFGRACSVLSLSAAMDESIEQAIKRLQIEAIDAVLRGAECIVLDDFNLLDGNRLWIDPILATAAIDKALRFADYQPNLRRQVGIVVRSGSLRDLHDIALCVSFGANAIFPYALYAVALGIAPKGGSTQPDADIIVASLLNTIKALTAGIEKVTSTIGCHELRGYGHSFSSIGIGKGIAQLLGTPNYFGSGARGLTWSMLHDDAEERSAELRGEQRARLQNPDRFYPKMWKKAEAVAHGEMSLEEYTEVLLNLEERIPVSIRHVLGIKEQQHNINPDEVDIRVKNHDMPVLISAMSFGSQGELAYRAYAEAAYRLNIYCVNGEGGELKEILGKYPHNRGQQVASGRFGVNIDFLNSCDLIEIKIGQGAKPGEGGHLPGFKVTEQVAAARSTTPGVALISPSNNHDLYSIEDLAQLIDELRTANTKAQVSVKIPVVPGVGIIAVGVAKAGADIITLTGYTGGTGAARSHALRHVGLPAEIGVWLSHRALVESELRDDVELWCDGGMKSGRDVVKMMCLGANRVGFGTLAMVAMGCTICRGCQDGTCHVGITTHIKTVDEATMKGLKSFRPRDYDKAVDGIETVFNMLGDDIRKWTAKLGFKDVQDLVGRADLLEQISMHETIDLTLLLRPVPQLPKKQAQPGGRRISRPRNTVSKQITDVVSEYVMRGDYELTYDDEQVMAMDRALGTHLAGAITRNDIEDSHKIEALNLSFSNSAVPGNGLGAFLTDRINVLVEGGAQDGVGKAANGGTVVILKGLNHNGRRLDGSVGKSFAYGAQAGKFIIQGDADTRACIRMSGADVVFGGEIENQVQDELGGLAARANLKGYAFEYMTSGRALVLGDPGPWMCAGMTGGVVYQRVQADKGLDIMAIQRRIAPGAVVKLDTLDEQGIQDVKELLSRYISVLEENNQADAVQHLYTLLHNPQAHFIKIAPPIQIH